MPRLFAAPRRGFIFTLPPAKKTEVSVAKRASQRASYVCLCLLLAGWCCAAPRSAAGQARGAGTPAQSAELEEAEGLSQQVQKLYGEGRYAEAIPVAERALAIRERALGAEHTLIAEALNRLAELYRKMGEYARAEPLYLRAVDIREKALGPDHPDVAQSLDGLAGLYRVRGDLVRAEPLYLRAVAIREKALGPKHPNLAESLNNLALLCLSKGELARAEPLLQRALSIREEALGPDHPDVSESLNNLALLYRNGGEYARAEPLFRRAITIREKALGPDHPGVANILNNFAQLYQDKGELARAEPLFLRALSIREKALGPEHPDVAQSLNNLAELYKARGDYARPETLFLRAIAIYEKALGPDHPAVATTLSNLAELYRARGELARAEPLFLRAIAIYEKALGPDHPGITAAVNNLAILYVMKAEYARAEPLFERALSVSEKALGPEHPNVATALNNLALLYDYKGEDARAEPLYRRALAVSEKALGPAHPDVALSLSNLALLYEATGDYARAVGFLSRAQEASEHNLSLVLAAGSERQKLAYLATLYGETISAVSLHARSAPSDPQALRLALTTILRRKGRALDAMSDQLSSLRRRLDPQDRALLDQLSAAQSELSALVLGGAGKSSAEEYRAAVARLEGEVERLQGEVSARSAEFRAQTQPVTIEQVRKALPQGTVLVEFFSYRPFNAQARTPVEGIGTPRYVAYVLKGNGQLLWADLGEAQPIDEGVGRLREALKDPDREDVKEVARALEERVMRPVRRLLGGARHVFLSPDGALNLIPFAALVNESGHYIVERYSITYLTSGRDLLRLRLSSPSRRPPLVVADPLFGREGAWGGAPAAGGGALPRRSSDLLTVSFPRLVGTAEEARAIVPLLPGVRVLTQAQATEVALKQVASPRVLHVATHGFFLPDQRREAAADTRGLSLGSAGDGRRVLGQSENPLLRSGLALAGANVGQSAGGEDGILTALEASALDLWGTKLVVLSACETGVGEVRTGDGVYGLRRALVLAGSESQVMSLWQVSDAATRDLMVAYYRRLVANEGRTEALRQVQLEMLRGGKLAQGGGQRGLFDKRSKAPSDLSHPYFWAAFIQSGDWRPLGGQAAPAK